MDDSGVVPDTCPAPACFIYDPVGPLALLSNYAHTPFEDAGGTWSSLEHFYQASKFEDAAHIGQIRASATAEAAKALAWSAALDPHVRAGWDDERVGVMRRALALKFGQHAAARRVLAGTWPLPILEDSPTDAFWGAGPCGDGDNMFGRLLEELRADLLGLPALFHLPGPARPAGAAGRSETRTARARWTAQPVGKAAGDGLAYAKFEALDILRQLGDLDGVAERHARHATLLDAKYAGYSWTDDARSAVPDWAERLKGILAGAVDRPLGQARVMAVGAGSANECANLWRDFGRNATLVDWGYALARNCAREAPDATVLRRRAERLDGIPDGAADVYCALRTYDSAFLDVRRALGEARRILAPGGIAVVSISDGYLTRGGAVVRGQIGADGGIERALPWRKLLEVARIAEATGFVDITFFDLDVEIGFSARARPASGHPSA